MAPGVNVFSSVPQGTGREGLVSVDLGSGVEELTNTVFQNSQATLNTITGEIIFVGLGKVDDFTGKDLTGKIALIQRGEIAFAEKVDNAIKAKAKGVLIFNNEPGLITGGLQTPVNIPVLMIEQAPGQALAAKTVSTKVEMGVVASDYAAMAGTSMASPHVAGVAALVRSANASLSPAQVRDVIKNTCHALSPNTDNQFGRGVVDAEAAVKSAMSAKLL
ncbi:MAG: S8 family serine peptidase [Bdellovibrionaceae bacterium]|nr:S8 family serine peptidase [Pseudobdellovibrionaceae bacterium]